MILPILGKLGNFLFHHLGTLNDTQYFPYPLGSNSSSVNLIPLLKFSIFSAIISKILI